MTMCLFSFLSTVANEQLRVFDPASEFAALTACMADPTVMESSDDLDLLTGCLMSSTSQEHVVDFSVTYPPPATGENITKVIRPKP